MHDLDSTAPPIKDSFLQGLAQPLSKKERKRLRRESEIETEMKLRKFAWVEEARTKRSVRNVMKLDPNQGQALKLGRYSFGLCQILELGSPVGLCMSDSPCTTIRTRCVTMNAPCVGFARITAILTANVCTTVGGSEDAYHYTPNSFGTKVDYPTLPPSQRATVQGDYSGLVPPPFKKKFKFYFSVRFCGRSTIAGGA